MTDLRPGQTRAAVIPDDLACLILLSKGLSPSSTSSWATFGSDSSSFSLCPLSSLSPRVELASIRPGSTQADGSSMISAPSGIGRSLPTAFIFSPSTMIRPCSMGGPAMVRILPALITTTPGFPAWELRSRPEFSEFPAAGNSGLSRFSRPGVSKLTAISNTAVRTKPDNAAAARPAPFKKT